MDWFSEVFICLYFFPPSSHACSIVVLMDWVSSCSVFRFSAHWWARLQLLVAMLAFPSPSALVSHKHSSPSLSSLSSPSSCSSSALLYVVEAPPSSCCRASFRRCGNSKSRAASSSSSKVPFPSYSSVEAASSACCYSENYEAASLSSSSCSKLGARLSLNSRPPHPLQSCRQGVLSGSLRKMRSPCFSLCLQPPNQARYAEKFVCGVWWWQLGKNRRGRVQASVPLPQPLRFIRRAFLSRLLTYSSNFSDIDPVQACAPDYFSHRLSCQSCDSCCPCNVVLKVSWICHESSILVVTCSLLYHLVLLLHLLQHYWNSQECLITVA